jgi:cytochrome P450
MAQAEPITFNPLDPSFRIDPYAVYRRLLAEDPVHETPFGARVFSRYDDCVAILRDHKRWSSDFRNAEFLPIESIENDMLGEARPFLFLDPPDHTRLRSLVSKAFTPRVVETLRPRIQEIVDGLLDAAADKGSLEVIEDLAYPLPVVVICELMGVPADDHAEFRQWSRELARALDPEPFIAPEVMERRRKAINWFDEFFRALIAERRRQPRDDLLSALIEAEEQGDRLTEAELLSTARLILIAGHETTVNLVGNGTLALLRHPQQLRQLRDDPSLARSATEEVLRYDPPVQYTGRIALEEVEVGGAGFRRGQQAVTLIGAANRDPRQFEDPETFDITRGDDRHLAFGFGIHYCLGAPLARVEGEIALSTLVRRFDGLELLVDELQYKENIVLRGLASLPVGFARIASRAG